MPDKTSFLTLAMPHLEVFYTILFTNKKKKTLIYNGKTTPGLFALVYTDSEALASGILNLEEVKFIGATTTHYDFSKKFFPAWPGAEQELKEDGTIGNTTKFFEFEDSKIVEKELTQLKKAQEEVQERQKALHQSWLMVEEQSSKQ